MLKRERLNWICQAINEKGIVHAQEIMNALHVSDMTVRRDLDELEQTGKLIRIHGGAQSLNYSLGFELSHMEKKTVAIREKKAIAQKASQLVKEGDTVYLGPGTTIEILASLLADREVRIITNSLPVFEQIEGHKADVILCGGNYRKKTGAFTGPLTNEVLRQLNTSLAFISCNGINNDQITATSPEEGEAQSIAMNNSRKRWLLADSRKLNRSDYYCYYHLTNTDGLITDGGEPDLIDHYRQFTNVVVTGEEDPNL